jgi:hypothetical protein
MSLEPWVLRPGLRPGQAERVHRRDIPALIRRDVPATEFAAFVGARDLAAAQCGGDAEDGGQGDEVGARESF